MSARKMVHYEVAEGAGAEDLERAVNRLLDNDYELWGSPVFCTPDDDVHWYVQAMVKYEEREEP